MSHLGFEILLTVELFYKLYNSKALVLSNCLFHVTDNLKKLSLCAVSFDQMSAVLNLIFMSFILGDQEQNYIKELCGHNSKETCFILESN